MALRPPAAGAEERAANPTTIAKKALKKAKAAGKTANAALAVAKAAQSAADAAINGWVARAAEIGGGTAETWEITAVAYCIT